MALMEWISILKCPVTGSGVRLLSVDEIELLQKKAALSQLWRADGIPFTGVVNTALQSVSGGYIYPVINDILIFISDLAIIDSLEKTIVSAVSADKKKVKDFYDEKGWIENESGTYKDALIYEDLREVSKEYVRKCHERLGKHLNPSGKYLLDAGSGTLQFPEYLQYSANYNYRVCVDFSYRALKEAKRKLGDKGICILGDLTALPIKDGVMDGFVCLNVVYHIPKDEQVTAVQELYRVLALNGKGVVVYEWFKHSVWMSMWMFPFRSFVFIKNRLLDAMGKAFNTRGAERRLYFFAHKPAYFRQHLPPYQLKVWRSVSVPFMRYYIHPWFFGKQILEWVYRNEEKDPELCGLKGEYPVIVFEK